MTIKVGRRQFLIGGGAVAGVTAIPSISLRAKSPRVRATGLKVDYFDRPLGLENPTPQLSWRIESAERNVRQRGYRVLVASSQEGLQAGNADLWDSGRVESRRTFGIRYEGKRLTSRMRCWWSVDIWEEQGVAAVSSGVSWWEMGLLEPHDWTAQWVVAEDPATQPDHRAGLYWIWGAPTRGKTARRFRARFNLPTACDEGALYVVTNDWSWWAQITRVWIDGVAVAGTGTWLESTTIAPTSAPDSLSDWIPLESLGAGEHLIAIEILTDELPSYIADSDHAHGLAFMARFPLSNGETQRVASGPHWKTSLGTESDWESQSFDDSPWQAAQAVRIDNFQPWPAQAALNLRREFPLKKGAVRARLYITALGANEARVNGHRVGDAFLAPEVSCFNKRVRYRAYDVTRMLQTGQNAIGLTVGDGWYAGFDGRYAWGVPPRRVLAQLEVTFADGSQYTLRTGPEWRVAQSPIRKSSIRSGEIFDARVSQQGWDAAQFDDSRWSAAQVAEKPSCQVTADVCPPIRVTQILQPRVVTQPRPGIRVFDFGQNFSGWCRLKVKGAQGTGIELKFAELLTPSGEISQTYMNMGEPKRDIFILRGDSAGETFEPHFTYRGFRYVQVAAMGAQPSTLKLEGVVIHSDLEMTGTLRIEAAQIEQLWRTTLWTQRSNFVAIPTDCPSREQRGWTGDAGVFWDAAAFNMDICGFTSRYMQNIADSQREDGAFPLVAPVPQNNDAFFLSGASAPGWGDAGIILPWTVWRRYGDLSIIRQNWDAMNRYLQFILDHNPDFVWRNNRGADFGDHLALDEMSSPGVLPATPNDLIGTAYWAHSAELLAQMSEAIGARNDQARLRAVSTRVREAFVKEFVKADGTVGNDTQAGYFLALSFGLLSGNAKRLATDKLEAAIRRQGVALTTGMLGTQFSLDVLADSGLTSLAYDLLLRSAFPSWGYMLRHGATTLWEGWSGEDQEGGTPIKLSQNHFLLGSICGFLFRRVAGIDAMTPGFESIIVRPVLDPRVKQGGGGYQSVVGKISTDWTQHPDGSLSLDVEIPANASAHVYLPARPGKVVRESGHAISGRSDLKRVTRSELEAVIEIGSGRYLFTVDA
jgi:alpha-L-rhamnosidase